MLYYLTSNESKFTEAKNYLSSLNIQIEQKKLDIPEIQSDSSSEISKFSAEYAKKTIKEAFFVMDRSLHIEGLGGFPGPYVKYVNNWFVVDNLISLFDNLSSYDAYWQTSIAYSGDKDITVFDGKLYGSIIKQPKGTKGWLFDRFFVPKESSKTLAEMSEKEGDEFWTSCISWEKFTSVLK